MFFVHIGRGGSLYSRAAEQGGGEMGVRGEISRVWRTEFFQGTATLKGLPGTLSSPHLAIMV